MSTSTSPSLLSVHREALTAAARDPHQGPVTLAVLTTLLRPTELVEPATWVRGGRLLVARSALHADREPLPREVPLSRSARAVLGDGDESLTRLLGLRPYQHDQVEDVPRSLGFDEGAASLWANAVATLLATCCTHHDQTAVFAYAGIAPRGVKATGATGAVTEVDLVAVAERIDHVVAGAGFEIS